ncbi:MAG: hypothetical protein P8J37_20915 [Fuerstiella sp.]|nr:hypothetical protein [Fuerstiella sp.]
MKPQYAALACVLLLGVVGCSDAGVGTPAAASEVLNTHCPVMGGEIDGQTFVKWNGQKVGFCCPPCIDDWKAMADAERTDKLAEAAASAGSSDEHSHSDHDDHNHGTTEEKDDHEEEHVTEIPDAQAETKPTE